MPPFGLYIHIPFCAKICHYCDFAKTARFGTDTVREYFAALECAFDFHYQNLLKLSPGLRFSSVYFGGGTPGLFTHEYAPLMAKISPFLAPGCEITLETNPESVTEENLKIWLSLGMQRLSIGVQSFQDQQLKFLTREHSGADARKAVALASKLFPRTSLDLIYGVPGQTVSAFASDLAEVSHLPVTHVSLYSLTYAEKTPFGRRNQRGQMQSMNENEEIALYQLARERLTGLGYQQYEVSNFSMPGHESQHNQLYWSGDFYLGIGAGAHGFLPTPESKIGLRYAYPQIIKRFITTTHAPEEQFAACCETREKDDYTLELLACGLRSRNGVDLAKISAATATDFRPTPEVTAFLQSGQLHWEQAEQRLFLHQDEWYREQAFALLLSECFSC